VRIDLHVHAKERSGCAVDGEEEVIQAAIGYGLDGLVFTDHHRYVPPERLEALNQRYAPFHIFGGIEVTVSEGEDLLVLGVHDQELEARDWSYQGLFDFARERDGFLILAHPFRYHDSIQIPIEQYPPDAIEVHSKNTRASHERRIRTILERLNLHPLCNSDAHRAAHVGVYYNQLERVVRDEDELLVVLRAGAYTCHSAEERIAEVNRERAAEGRYEV